MHHPFLSVIVPVYRVETTLDECVRSIVSQSFADLQLILVDDGSPDACPAMCDSWAKRDGRISVVHKPNGGLSDARNAGIGIAEGELESVVNGLVISHMTLPELVVGIVDEVPSVIRSLFDIPCPFVYGMLVESVETGGIDEIDDSLSGSANKYGGVACHHLSAVGLGCEYA